MFDSRPDKLKAARIQIDNLTTLLNDLRIHNAQQAAVLDQQRMEQSLPSFDQLCNQQECQKDKVEHLYRLLSELSSKKVMNRFCECMTFEFYCQLVDALKATICICEKRFAEIQFQIACYFADEAAAKQAELVELIQDQIEDVENEETPDDSGLWLCQKYIDGVLNVAVQG